MLGTVARDMEETLQRLRSRRRMDFRVGRGALRFGRRLGA